MREVPVIESGGTGRELPLRGLNGRIRVENYSEKENVMSFFLQLGFLVFLVFAFKSSVLDANNIPSGSMIPTLKIGDYLFVNKMRYSLHFPYTDLEVWRYDNPHRGDIITFIPPPPGDTGKHYVKRVMGMPGDRIRIRNIPACGLNSYLHTQEEKNSVPGSADKEAPADREYRCDPMLPGQVEFSEPVIALFEYRENDQGPWKNYHPGELPAQLSRTTLHDADNVRVLHPSVRPTDPAPLPVLFQETINGTKHTIVESSYAVPAPRLCPSIETEGCLIPEGYYMVMGDNRDDSNDSRYLGYIHRDRILGKAVMVYFSINWRDDICKKYLETVHHSREYAKEEGGFLLEDFPPEKQQEYCSLLDYQSEGESVSGYFKRTILYRLGRLSVRWYRIGTLLK